MILRYYLILYCTIFILYFQLTYDFFSLLQVLQQEGWHFELEKPSDPLTFKGVVYNEMKGVYSSPDSLLDRTAKEALFPDNT